VAAVFVQSAVKQSHINAGLPAKINDADIAVSKCFVKIHITIGCSRKNRQKTAERSRHIQNES
jgi:hypothetical protein